MLLINILTVKFYFKGIKIYFQGWFIIELFPQITIISNLNSLVT